MNIKTKTDIYCIIGYPLNYSLSSVMHNTAFRELNINAYYAVFEVKDFDTAFRGIKALGIKGGSITMPYKIECIKYLDEISDIGRMIGAINTFKIENDKVYGTNTDAYGFFTGLNNKISVENKTIAIIGSGGAARACIFSLFYYSKPKRVLVFSRNKTTANEIIENLRKYYPDANAEHHFITEFSDFSKEIDILANTTPVGMYPDINESPVDKNYLNSNMVVYDIVYKPLKTKLLQDAEEKGCQIIYGLDMLLYQGLLQFEYWLNIKPPEDIIKNSLYSSLNF